MPYDLEGRMQEVCTCATFCPCWAGLDPDGGTCDFSWIFHFDTGHINGVDVSDRSMAFLGHLPGNVVNGNVRMLVLVDETTDEAQSQALLGAFTGAFGGPLADLASLVGEVVGVERGRIEFDVHEGTGTFRAGDLFAGRIKGLRSPTGAATTLQDTALSPVLGSPAYPATVEDYSMPQDRHGFRFTPGQAIQTRFHYVA